jgi:hypothetical protein
MATKNFDYKSIDFGVKIPFKTDQMGMMYVTKNVTINPKIDETIFQGK